MATGLSRMGWDLNILKASLHHGAIMVGGFLGTLIALEKVIPLKKKLLFIIPALGGASVLFFFVGQPVTSFFLVLTASLLLVGVFFYYMLRTKDLVYFMMMCGSICWLTGNAVLITKSIYPPAFPWWMGFILFVITAERLELAKFLPVSRSLKTLLVVLLFVYAGGVMWSFHHGGQWMSGIALVAIAVWLMQYDVIGISIRKQGLQKFIATALLSGYFALLLTGVFLLTLMNHVFGYDAIVHTFFIGFVFSMIFAHGPVILPGVLGLAVKPWHPLMYVWLVLLHISLAIRITADLLHDMELRKMTGVVSAVAMTGYFVTIAIFTIRQQRSHAEIL